MRDVDFERQKNRCQPYFEKWVHLLGLDSWEIKVRYTDEPMQEDDPSGHWTFATFMHVMTDWSRMRGTVEVFCANLTDLSERELERSIIHELCHVIVNEMHDDTSKRRDHEERAVEGLAKAFQWVAEARLDDLTSESDSTAAPTGVPARPTGTDTLSPAPQTTEESPRPSREAGSA